MNYVEAINKLIPEREQAFARFCYVDGQLALLRQLKDEEDQARLEALKQTMAKTDLTEAST